MKIQNAVEIITLIPEILCKIFTESQVVWLF